MEYEIHSAYMGATADSSPSQGSSHRNHSSIYEQSRQRVKKHFDKRFPKGLDRQVEQALEKLKQQQREKQKQPHSK